MHHLQAVAGRLVGDPPPRSGSAGVKPMSALMPGLQSSDRLAQLKPAVTDSSETWTAPEAASAAGAPTSTAASPSPAGAAGAAACTYHFSGWEAEEELSCHWGSSSCSSAGAGDEPFQPLASWQQSTHYNRLFSAGSSSVDGSPAEAPGSRCCSFYVPGSGVGLLASLQGLRRPCSAPAGDGHKHYTFRTDAILEGSSEAAVPGTDAAAAAHLHTLQTFNRGSFDSTGGLPGLPSDPEQAGACMPLPERTTASAPGLAAVWQRVPYPEIPWQPAVYPAIFSSAAPDGATARAHGSAPADRQEEEDEQASLADEPSAPPLYDEPWAADDAGGTEAAIPLPAVGHGGLCTARRAVRFADSPDSGASPGCSTLLSREPANEAADASWGASACAAAAARQRSSSAGSSWSGWGSAAGSDSEAQAPSREVSEESRSFRQMLDTLAARRRAGAVASQPTAVAAAVPGSPKEAAVSEEAVVKPHRQGSPGGLPGRARHSSGASGLSLAACSPAPHPMKAPLIPAAAAAQRWSPGKAGPPAGAAGSPRWAGMQTYLGNLSKSAEPEPAPRKPGVGFWEQFAAEQAEAERAQGQDDPAAWDEAAECAAAACEASADDGSCWVHQEQEQRHCDLRQNAVAGGCPVLQVQEAEVPARATMPCSPTSPGRRLASLLRSMRCPSPSRTAVHLASFSPLGDAAHRLPAERAT